MKKLATIFASVLNIEELAVTAEVSPQNTPSWDSLNAIVLVTEIEQAYNVKFSYQEVMSIKNFGDVLELLKSKGADVSA